MPDSDLISIDARQRLTPVLPPSSLVALRQSPASGWGVYATQNLVEGTQLSSRSGVAVNVIYRAYRKEVCAWCFRYDDGRHWKVHAYRDMPGGGDQKLGVVVFCSDECRDNWVKSVGELGVGAYCALEDFVYRRTRKTDWAKAEYDRAGANDVPSTNQVEEVSEVLPTETHEKRSRYRSPLRLRMCYNLVIIPCPIRFYVARPYSTNC